MAVLGVDVGGTFTDAVVLDGGRVTTAKVLTASHQEESVVVAARAAGATGMVERFAHGTTVATNALLERKGARTAFVTNAGFEHLLHLRRKSIVATAEVDRPRRDVNLQIGTGRDHRDARTARITRDSCSPSMAVSVRSTTSPIAISSLIAGT